MSASHPSIEASWLPFDPSSSSWSDVTPTLQDDGPADALCPIMYDPSYSSAMDLFRTLYPLKELSPRALALTTHLSALNPSNYSIWSYRADILIDGLDSTLAGVPKSKRLQDELDWMEATTKTNLKSYQVWQHRRLILSALSSTRDDGAIDMQMELAFIASVLGKDAKNYHTWAYRQWILCQYAKLNDDVSPNMDVWVSELKYTDDLLKDDGRNNSAWNHRYFLLFGSRRAETYGPQHCGLSDSHASTTSKLQDCIRSEVEFVKRHISLTPSNVAPFVYLRGILQHAPAQSASTPLPLSSFSLESFMAGLLPNAFLGQHTTINQQRLPVPVLEYLLDIYAEKHTAAAQITQLIAILTQQDPIRKGWWDFRKSELAAS